MTSSLRSRLSGKAWLGVLTAVALSMGGLSDEVLSQEIDYAHPAYEAIELEAFLGDRHVDQFFGDYGAEFPTSGPHAPTPAAPGFYDEPIVPEPLVHALEHGNIVIYFEEPGDVAIEALRRWTGAYVGSLDGVIAVRTPGLGERVVLTAWQRKLSLDRFDVRAAYFVDAFRGRGPESRVR